MFESIKAFAASLTGPKRTFDENDYRVAAVALFIHAAEADGRVLPVERERIRSLLVVRMGLDAGTAAALIRQAEEGDHELSDIASLAATLRRVLDEEGRGRIVDMLWEVATSDGSVHEFEDDYINRVAELLGVGERRTGETS